MAAPALSEASKPRKPDAEERRWRAEDALRCLTRAEEIRKDKALMKDVMALAEEQKTALDEIAEGDDEQGDEA